MEDGAYHLLASHERRIRDLVGADKYRSEDDFVKMAIEILLDWESDHPEDCLDRMKSLLPFTPVQQQFMVQFMNSKERKKQFGEFPTDMAHAENSLQENLAENDKDHLTLRNSQPQTLEYLQTLDVKKPENVIPNNGYPRLSGFYSRLLPVKIVIAVLAYRLAATNSTAVKLSDLRAHAYDIAEEIAGVLTRNEHEKNTPRNEKLSTGLPKKGLAEKDFEKMAPGQKRFKDQFVGKIRTRRNTKVTYFDGALSSLGLAHIFVKDGTTLVSLSDLGRRFAMLENPIISGDYENKSFSRDESDYILDVLIPQLPLEKMFVDASLETVGGFGHDNEKASDLLNEGIRGALERYSLKHPDDVEKYGIRLTLDGDSGIKKLNQWRLATMGRLAELGAVKWTINEKGDSVYSLGR